MKMINKIFEYLQEIFNILFLRLNIWNDRQKGRKIILIDHTELSFASYILPIISELKKMNKNISFYLATNEVNIGCKEFAVYNIPSSKQFKCKLSRHLSVDILLSAHIHSVKPRKSININIFHNQPIKYPSFPRSDFKKFHIHFLVSPINRIQIENIIKSFNLETSNIKLFNIGYPKSDELLSGKFNKSVILEKLGLNPGNKTILYAPSWDDGLSLRTKGKELIENILKISNINLIVKLHPVSYVDKKHPQFEFYTGGKEWGKELNEFDKYQNYLHIKSMDNINPYLAAADIMLTDLSSVALEFMMLDKPIIYMDCPEFFEDKFRKTYTPFGVKSGIYIKNSPITNGGRQAGIVVKDYNELTNAINQSCKYPEEFSYKRKRLINLLCYNKGCSTIVAAKKILELLNEDINHQRNF